MQSIKILALLAGKTGGMAVGVLFLPIYHHLLGDGLFSQVAVIISLQAFALMVDLGMSVLVGRDIAAHEHGADQSRALWHHAKAALGLAYGLVLIATLGHSLAVGRTGTDMLVHAGCVLLLLLSTLQNVDQTVLLAKKRFVLASAVQVGGVLFRATATVAALRYVEASMLVFVSVQVIATALHMLVTDVLCERTLREGASATRHPRRWATVATLLHRGRPLVLAGLAGAAAMQLDKPIVSMFASAEQVSAYFLAMSFSALPASLLAGPIVQFFQPQIIRLTLEPHSPRHDATIGRFSVILMLAVALPSWLLWEGADLVVHAWLKTPGQVDLVVQYVRLLLPAFAIGSLGFVPVILLMAAQDFRYQAVTSTAFTVATLGLVAWFGHRQRLDLVCLSYIAYFCAAFISVWARALTLGETRLMARRSLTSSLAALAAIAVIGGCIVAGVQRFPTPALPTSTPPPSPSLQ